MYEQKFYEFSLSNVYTIILIQILTKDLQVILSKICSLTKIV